MADQNQDSPLVVSEILIEMHELRGDIKQLQTMTVHLSHNVTKLETSVDKLQVEMHEVRGAIVQLAGSIKTLADESRSNTEMLIAAFREEGLYVRQLLHQHDARIAKTEDNQLTK